MEQRISEDTAGSMVLKPAISLEKSSGGRGLP